MHDGDEPTPEEQLDIEAADAYLDAVGNKRDFEGDQLGATQWRKDVDAEPLDMGQLPSAHTASGKLPSAPPTGGRMSFDELAREFAGIKDLTPHQQLQDLYAVVGQMGETGKAIIGENASSNWQAKVAEVRAQITSTMESLEGLDAYIDETAGRIANQNL